MNVEIDNLAPGIPGVSHGSGITGEIIRHATESWAGHAVIYVGDGNIVEGVPPKARISSATKYNDMIWLYKMPLIVSQQAKAVERAHALVGTDYDYPAYMGFALEILGIKSGEELDPVFKGDKWRVCSALVDDCLTYAGFQLDWSAIHLAPGQDPNLVSPGMILALATMKGWV